MSNAANRILGIMASAGTNTISDLSYGTVTSVDPIKIVREGERTPLTEEFLVLSKMCKEFKIVTGLHSHTISGESINVFSAGSHQHTVPANTAQTSGEHSHSVPAATSGSTAAPTAHTHSIPANTAQAAGNHTHSVPANTAQTAGEHSHSVGDVDTGGGLGTLLVWPGLHVGERVILLSFSDNQRFFVERLEQLSNEV